MVPAGWQHSASIVQAVEAYAAGLLLQHICYTGEKVRNKVRNDIRYSDGGLSMLLQTLSSPAKHSAAQNTRQLSNLRSWILSVVDSGLDCKAVNQSSRGCLTVSSSTSDCYAKAFAQIHQYRLMLAPACFANTLAAERHPEAQHIMPDDLPTKSGCAGETWQQIGGSKRPQTAPGMRAHVTATMCS